MDERIPIFLLDSHEKFQPLAVESVEAVPATMMLPPPGHAGPDAEGSYRDSGPVQLGSLPLEGGRMNFPGRPTPEEQETSLPPELRGVGYRRELEDGGLTWIQYWLWYLYNPKVIALVAGKHEGDWEFVQVGYRDGEPVAMTVSQHHSGGKRGWDQVKKRDGRPLIYVARDSHANFFEATDEIQEIADDADGEGAPLADLKWREFGPWANWFGRWGNSTEEGKSPESPGRQCQRWYLPRGYHEGAESQ
ncbi:MAG TPA: hypothetical protein VMS11_06370 [Solirubrobacterales bacterium]|nr:hypothetical protein [Solirubrobacterales bacterium]